MRVLAAILLSALAGLAQERPPNVVLLFSDDQGTVDVNVFGAEDLHTPNLNKLAREGTRFTQFYVGAPVCSPSRASLLTGRYPQRAGVPGNVGIDQPGMSADQVTIADVLKKAGYRTGITGKWHLGSANGRGPLDQGFDYFFGHMRGCIDNYSHYFYWSGPNVHDLWRNDREIFRDGEYFPALVAEQAIEFIEANRGEPFFLYVPFNIPHYPYQPTDKWRQTYRFDADAKPEENRFYYSALVSTLDEQIGKIVDFLGRAGVRDNTLVIFLSDHGHSTEERAMFGGGSAGPYRGAKFSLFEGGIRVPAIMSLPGVIPEGEVREQFATSLDWLPTIAELTGAELPGEYRIDGKSLMPIIRDAKAPSQHETFHWQLRDQWAVRDGDWKLVVNARDTDMSDVQGGEKVFLSNMAKDATERTNIAKQNPEVVERLKAKHERWAADVNAAAGERASR